MKLVYVWLERGVASVGTVLSSSNGILTILCKGQIVQRYAELVIKIN